MPASPEHDPEKWIPVFGKRSCSANEPIWRKRAARIACMIVLGALLAGCDKCGDWWWGAEATQSCKNTLPKQ